MKLEQIQPASLQKLCLLALTAFPDNRKQILAYVQELCSLLAPEGAQEETGRNLVEQAKATRDATEDDEFTLLCKFESYLESVLMGRWAKGGAADE